MDVENDLLCKLERVLRVLVLQTHLSPPYSAIPLDTNDAIPWLHKKLW